MEIKTKNTQQQTTLWPYILPLPLDPEKRELVMSVLRSSIATAILMKIRLDAPSYQQQLIQKLPYSNKTIIQNLKLMVKASILQQDMQVVATKTRRRTWVKYYKPTNLGKWIILLFTSPKQVSPEQTRSIVKELFLLYASSIVEVCKKHQIDIEVFHEILSREHSRELVRIAKPQKKPEVVVFGSVAMDTYGYAQSFPKMDETVYVEEIGRYPGGMGANVALALTKLGVPVAFVARLGNDQTGRQLLQNLKENNIDLSNLSISTQKSLETLIIHDSLENRWIFAVGSKDSAISIISPDEVHWSTILESRIVYIGEVFVELASLIANFAKTKNKAVIYRPGTPYLKYGIEKLRPVLETTDIFIINESGWKILREESKNNIEAPTDILGYGPSTVIITKGSKGCEIHDDKKSLEIAIPKILVKQFKIIDPTGAGDGFSAGLIKKLLEGKSTREAVDYAQVVAVITCSRIGASPSFPTLKEVEKIMEKEI